MPAGSRVRANNVYGTVSDNPLLVGAVSFTSLGLSLLPPISGQHAVIVLDPKRVFGDPEIVVVTSHLAMGTTATITRGTYGTTAREHPQGTPWAHVPIDEDYTEILTSSTRPSDPYEGQVIYETDFDRFAFWNGSTWLTAGLNARMGWHLTRAAAQSVNPDTLTSISWDTEIQDTPGNFTPPGTTITVPTGGEGLWVITAQLDATALQSSVGYNFIRVVAGGLTFQNNDSDDVGTASNQSMNLTVIVPLVATNTIVVSVQHSSGAATSFTGRFLAYRIGN